MNEPAKNFHALFAEGSAMGYVIAVKQHSAEHPESWILILVKVDNFHLGALIYESKSDAEQELVTRTKHPRFSVEPIGLALLKEQLAKIEPQTNGAVLVYTRDKEGQSVLIDSNVIKN